MNQAVFQKASKTFKQSETGDIIRNNISAINTGAFALGAIIGPILGSVLTDEIGFRTAFLVIGLFFAGFTIVMFVFICVG